MVQNELKQDNKQKPSTNTDRLERPFFLYVGVIWSIIKASCKLNIVVPLLGKDRTNSHKKLHVQGIKYSNRERAETKSTQMEEYTIDCCDGCMYWKENELYTDKRIPEQNKNNSVTNFFASLFFLLFINGNVWNVVRPLRSASTLQLRCVTCVYIVCHHSACLRYRRPHLFIILSRKKKRGGNKWVVVGIYIEKKKKADGKN